MKKIAATLVASIALAAAGAQAAAPAQPGAAQPAAAAAPAPAVSAATTAAVKDLLDAMRFRVSMKTGLDAMAKNAPNMMRAQAEAAIKNSPKMTEAQRTEKLAKLNEELPRVQAAMQGVFNDQSLYADIETELVPIYAAQFTVEEMKQLSAFYRTPTGAKSLQVIPVLMPQVMAVSQRVAQPRIQKAIQQLQKK